MDIRKLLLLLLSGLLVRQQIYSNEGTIVTLPTQFDNEYKLDLQNMTNLTHWWIEQGLGTDPSPLKVAAAMGEGPMLSDYEWPLLLRTVVNAAGNDTNIICALKTKDTIHTIKDAKKTQDLGAIALQIDPPIFHNPTQDDYVRYFSTIADAIDIGITIYNTHWFGCESVTSETMLRLQVAEHVAAIKWSVPQGQDYDDMRQFTHIFNVIDNSNQPVRCRKNGGQGYISNTVAAHPALDLQVWKLLESHLYDEVQHILDTVDCVMKPWTTSITKKSRNIRPVKGIMAAMGKSSGPLPLPYFAAYTRQNRTDENYFNKSWLASPSMRKI